MFAVAIACAIVVPDPRPARWAAELGSARFDVRAAAAEALEKAGPAAVPALTAAAKALDPETATRATELLARIARKQVADRLLTPTVVTLPAEPQTVADALASLAKQTGFGFDLADPTAAVVRFTPPAGPVPLWVAVRAVCDAAELEVIAVAPRGRPRGAETAAERRLAQFQAELEGLIEETIPRQIRTLESSRQTLADQTDPVEIARWQAAVRRQEEEFDGLVRYCFDKAVRREVARLAALDPGPDVAGRVMLRPTADPAAAVAVVGGVRVEGRAAPSHLAAGVVSSQVAAVIRVRAEPRRPVERVDGVWVRRASAGGKELARGPDAGAGGPVVRVPVYGGHIRLGAEGKPTHSDVRLDRTIGVVGPAEAVVRVTAPPGTEKLAELFGVVRAVVRDDPAELVAGPVPGTATADDLRLTAEAPVVDEAGRLGFDLTVSYDPAALHPGGGAGVRFDPDMSSAMFARGGFIRFNVIQAAGVVARAGPTADGLTVRDAAGTVLEATVVRASRADGTAGRVADKLHLRMTAKDGHGPPARVAFGGGRAVPVDLPFAMTDVPVTVGTARDVRHD